MCSETPVTQALGILATDPSHPLCALLRKCPVMQEYLLQKGLVTLDELMVEGNFELILLDNADLKKITNLADRTLQKKRTRRQIPYTKLGGKVYYFWNDIEKILRDNYRAKTEKLLQKENKKCKKK